MPDLIQKIIQPKSRYTRPRDLFKNPRTGEYGISMAAVGKQRGRFVSLKTTDREEALRRLERTGVGGVMEVANDERFTEQVIDVLESRNKVTLGQVVSEYLADLEPRVNRMSMAHPRAITGQFSRLFPTDTGIDEITSTKANEWINTGFTMTMRRRRQSVLGALFKFAFDQGYRKDNVAARLTFQTQDFTFEDMEREVKEPFTEAEYQQLLACDKVQGFWRWAIQLSWWLGLRISDCCDLQWGSLCAVPGKLVVWQRKTRRRMELDLSDPVLGGGVITQILAGMRAEVTDAVYCFPEARDMYQNRRQRLSDQFRDLCYAAGMQDNRKTFHSFRKSAALRWQAAGRSLDEIGTMLGHEGTGNTQFYLETTRK